MVRRAWNVVVALGTLVLLAWILPSAPAHADDQGDRAINRYAVVATALPDGIVEVQLEIDFNFNTTPGHGMFLTLLTRQEIEGDPDHYRVLEISDVAVASPTGAPDEYEVDRAESAMVIRIGDEDIDDVSGVQRYLVSYSVAGLPTPGVGAAGEDEIYWNVIGSAFEVPISDVTVQLTGPAEPEELTCYTGRVGSSQPCGGFSVDDAVASFSQDFLAPGQGLSVVTSYPADTFDAEPILAPRRTVGNVLGMGTPVVPASGVLALAGIGAVAALARRRGRDASYLGLTPGLVPAPGQQVSVGWRRKVPVAVQFAPPPQTRPGEIGTLTDEVADPRDVIATFIDLAVRGYFRIEEVPDSQPRDWLLVRDLDRSWDELIGFERILLRGVFSRSDQSVRLRSLGSRFGAALEDAQGKLYDEMVERGWYRRSPRAVRMTWLGRGALVLLGGIILGALLGWLAGAALVGVAVSLVGVAVMAGSRAAPARTADGTAILVQALGFEKYLETAEGDRLRFEAGQDIFSRYLPYAIAFGVADRWVGLFAELAEAGQELPAPTWYVGPVPATSLWAVGGFGESVGALTEATQTSLVSDATPGSSGFSGFSSGGFSGGGVGGGGGGGW